MHSSLVIAVLLPLLSSALPATDGKPSISWNSDGRQVVSFAGDSAVNFDDLDAETGLDLPIRSLKSVCAYSLLSYDNLGVVNNAMTKKAGLKPFSKPNVLGFDKVFVPRGKQTITSKYNDSTTDFCEYFSTSNLQSRPAMDRRAKGNLVVSEYKDRSRPLTLCVQSISSPSTSAVSSPTSPRSVLCRYLAQ